MPKVSPELLSILRCPVTHSPLVQEGDELVSTEDAPSGGKVRYPIEDGIPILLPPAVQPGDDDGASTAPVQASGAPAEGATPNP